MKYLKKYDNFEPINEIVGLAGAGLLYALYRLLIANNMPYLSNNPIKNFYRYYKISKVIKKYKPLIEELNAQFATDPEIKDLYKEIKKIGHADIQTEPVVYVEFLQDYVLRNVPESKRNIVNKFFEEFESEIEEIGYDVRW